MATYLVLTNRVLEALNEVTLSTDGSNFTSSRGIQSAVKTFINKSINDIYNAELQWSYLHSDTTQATTAGTAEYSLPADFRHVDYDTFILKPTQLVSTNEFSADSNWTHSSGSISGGFLVLTAGSSSQQTITSFIANRNYRATFRMTGTGTVSLKVGTSSGGTQVLNQEFTVSNAGEGEVHTTTFEATASTLYVTLASASATSNIDYITINENIQPQRLTYITYEDFQRNYRENDLANNPESYGIPKFVYSTQDGKFGLSPIPDRSNYTIAYEYWKTHTELSDHGDTPDLTTRYHDIIVSRAKYYAYILRGNQVMAQLSNQEYIEGLARMRIELINRDEQMRSI